MTWLLRSPARKRLATAAHPSGASPEEDWADVAGLADLRQNRLVIEFENMSVLIVRAGSSMVAVEDECPHVGRKLSDGSIDGRVIKCSSHGYCWDLITGRSVRSPRGRWRRPLRRVRVRVTGERILLARPASSAAADDPSA